MPGLEGSISLDTSPPTHGLMSDGIASEQVKKFLFRSRKIHESVQNDESLEIYIPEVRNPFTKWEFLSVLYR